MRKLTWLIIGSAVGCILILPVALAGTENRAPGKVFKRVGVANIDGAQGTIGRAVAKCPRGSRVVSGGWFMTDPEETELLVFESRRRGRRGWEVRAIQATANSLYTDLVALAYCDDDAPRAKRVSTTGVVESGETGSLVAECPRKKKAIAGGFSLPTDADFDDGGFPVVSRRVGKRTWRSPHTHLTPRTRRSPPMPTAASGSGASASAQAVNGSGRSATTRKSAPEGARRESAPVPADSRLPIEPMRCTRCHCRSLTDGGGALAPATSAALRPICARSPTAHSNDGRR